VQPLVRQHGAERKPPACDQVSVLDLDFLGLAASFALELKDKAAAGY
jgi:hypothetical protein